MDNPFYTDGLDLEDGIFGLIIYNFSRAAQVQKENVKPPLESSKQRYSI
jgi:hypothetical protein